MMWHSSGRLSRAARAALVSFSFSLIQFGSAEALSASPPLDEPLSLVFDGDVAPGNPEITGLQIGPWLFASQQFHSVTLPDAGLLAFADNGTPYIASVGGGLDYPITLERTDAAPFALLGFDAAEGFLDDIAAAKEGFVSATTIEVEAMLATGFTVTLTFDLDAQRDGPGGIDDFQSFLVPAELRNITSVTFAGLAGARRDAGFALDNVVVAAVVPEPASATLLFAAAGAITAIAALRKRRAANE